MIHSSAIFLSFLMVSSYSVADTAKAKGTYLALDLGFTTSDGEAVINGAPAEATSSILPGADFDDEIHWGISFGHQLKNGLGLEIEYIATRFEVDSAAQTIPARPEVQPFLEGAQTEDFLYKGETEINNLSLNLSYHYYNKTSFTPFVRLGAGYAEVEASINYTELPRFDIFALPTLNFDPSDTSGMTWNFGLGAAYALNEALHLEVEYVVSDFDTDLSSPTDPESGSRVDFLDFNNSRLSISVKLWL